MNTTLDKVRKLTAGLREREQQQAHDLIRQYRQLVRNVTDGKALDPETVIEQLYECGKTAEELEADCIHLATRRELFSRLEAARKQVDLLPALRAEQSRNLAEADAEHKAWQAKWKAREEPLLAALRAGNLADTQVTILTEQLMKAAWPELQERLNDVQHRRGPILEEWQLARLTDNSPVMANLQPELEALAAEEAAIRSEMITP